MVEDEEGFFGADTPGAGRGGAASNIDPIATAIAVDAARHDSELAREAGLDLSPADNAALAAWMKSHG